MSKKKNRAQMIKEADDIIRNTLDDENAVAFMQETWIDDFPDLDLGRMDLHEAVDELEHKLTKKKLNTGQKAIYDLNRSLDKFIEKHDKARAKADAKRRKQKRKTKK